MTSRDNSVEVELLLEDSLLISLVLSGAMAGVTPQPLRANKTRVGVRKEKKFLVIIFD